jgi:hypothetical protein
MGIMNKVLVVRNAHDGTFIRDQAGPVTRTKVCTYQGSAYVAERDDNGLNIYLVSSEPMSTETVGDRGRPTGDAPLPHLARFDSPRSSISVAKLQAMNEASRKPSFQDKLCGCGGK